MLHYDQAQATCDEHHYLIGAQIKKGWRITGVVTSLIVAPFDGINQYRFLKAYKQTQDAVKSREFYKGDLYTVLLVVQPITNPHETVTLELEKYLEEHAERTAHYA